MEEEIKSEFAHNGFSLDAKEEEEILKKCRKSQPSPHPLPLCVCMCSKY
uniref:Uncharacterized protein n=1 Tax=Nymphaea colorata TaxID=210225 RepID=A0A5K0ZWY2_9MAGN